MDQPVTIKVTDGIAVITMDDKGKDVNTTREAFVESLFNVVEDLYEQYVYQGALKGVVLISGKPGVFHVGGDLKGLNTDYPTYMGRLSIAFINGLYRKISALPVPVVAAINGHCMGGGLELALACTARIAAASENTLVGLPEIAIGLFPSSGGTQRLPRLIGYPAIDFILNSRIVPVQEAFEIGVIDELVPPNALFDRAVALVREIVDGTAQFRRPEFDFSDAESVIAEVREQIAQKNGGKLAQAPAVMLKVLEIGLKYGLDAGLDAEARYFVDLSRSDEFRATLHTFFLKNMINKPKKMMTEGFVPKALKKVAVFGLGEVGKSIALGVVTDMKAQVVVCDTPEQMRVGREWMERSLTALQQQGRLKEPVSEILARIREVSNCGLELADVDIALEAYPEEFAQKCALFSRICALLPIDCLIATTTAELSVTALAKHVSNPERFGGLHFVSHVWGSTLLEIVRSEATAQATVDNFLNFSALMRKRPILCRANAGFVVEAMCFPILDIALTCVEEGTPIDAVDRALEEFGFAFGPFKMLDEIGIAIGRRMYLNCARTHKSVENLHRAGFTGRNGSGKSLFLPDGALDPEAAALITLKSATLSATEPIPARLLREQVVVGQRLLDTKVVDDPQMIDIAMVFGAGYPGEKGGPLKWADLMGLSEAVFGEKFYDTSYKAQ